MPVFLETVVRRVRLGIITAIKVEMYPSQLRECSLVLLKDDHTTPTDWRLGQVIELHHGSDGIPRVASIKTWDHKIVQRNLAKLKVTLYFQVGGMFGC